MPFWHKKCFPKHMFLCQNGTKTRVFSMCKWSLIVEAYKFGFVNHLFSYTPRIYKANRFWSVNSLFSKTPQIYMELGSFRESFIVLCITNTSSFKVIVYSLFININKHRYSSCSTYWPILTVGRRA